MTIQPLTSWCCDVCQERIESVDDAHVIWELRTGDRKAHSFKIIHKSRCDRPDDHGASAPLSDYLGTDGLACLFSHLSLGPLKLRAGHRPYCDVADLDEFVDFMRRVQTPYYDKARTKFADPDIREELADSNEVAPYLQASLMRLAAS